MICDDDNRNFCFCSFFLWICCGGGGTWINGKSNTLSLEASGMLFKCESDEDILEFANGAAR